MSEEKMEEVKEVEVKEEVKPVEEKNDIAEIKELLMAVKILGVTGKKVAKDGISVQDIPAIVEMFKKFDVLLEGFNDLPEAIKEVKDLDQMEVMQIITELFAIFKAIKDA